MKITDKYILLLGGLIILGFLLGIATGLAHIHQGASPFRNIMLFIGVTVALLPLSLLAFSIGERSSGDKS